MPDGNGKLIRLQAYEYLKHLERPPSISPRQWPGVREFLWKVARGQPRYYPSQIRIAREMGIEMRSLQRYIRLAKEAGLLTVWYDAGVSRRGSFSKTSQYLITELLEHDDKLSAFNDDNLSGNDTGALRNPCISKKDTPCPELRSEHSVSLRPPAGPQPNLPAVGKLSASEALARANDGGRIRRRPRAKDPDASRRLVGYFCDRWESVLLEVTDQFEQVRPLDTIGAATGYIRTTFISPSAGRQYSEYEVRALIDDFLLAVLSNRVLIKPGQSGFARFIGWWGRSSPSVISTPKGEYLG